MTYCPWCAASHDDDDPDCVLRRSSNVRIYDTPDQVELYDALRGAQALLHMAEQVRQVAMRMVVILENATRDGDG